MSFLTGNGGSGYSGYSGQDGTIGVNGTSGYSGISGYSGTSGTSGTSGYSGISGYSGSVGTSGYSGQQPGISVVAGESLSAGNFVNLYNDGGTIKMRKADSTDGTKPADGFVDAAVSATATGTLKPLIGLNSNLSSLTIDATYWLSTAGGVTSTAPSTAGNLVQELGSGFTATVLFINAKSPILLT